MRAFSSHLYLFYEDDSSVVIHEAQVEEASDALHANTPQVSPSKPTKGILVFC